MLDRATAPSAPSRLAAGGGQPGATRPLWALLGCAAFVLVLHLLLLRGLGGWVGVGTAEPLPAPLSVRTVPAPAPSDPAPVALAADPAAEVPPAPPRPSPPGPRSTRQATTRGLATDRAEASADTVPAQIDQPPPSNDVAHAPLPGALAAAEPPSSAASEAASPAAASATTPPVLLGAGEAPPPRYRTALPPAGTLRYQVRRGFLRGTGEIRWEPSGDRYRLALEARIAGVALLTQTSEGHVGEAGLAPVRFLDQRARRAPQAANFRRDDERITFSGNGAEWPLLVGSQDRLSWMIQLAGIVAADPGHLVEGGRIAMVVVGARGDAAVWTLRYVGREAVETAAGSIDAVKFVRDARSTYDTSAEIWLDPAQGFLPAHATLRNSSGASEYDLLLERIER